MFSYLKQRLILVGCKHRIIFCHWFVAKTSKYREATVLKVIRIFLYQPPIARPLAQEENTLILGASLD